MSPTGGWVGLVAGQAFGLAGAGVGEIAKGERCGRSTPAGTAPAGLAGLTVTETGLTVLTLAVAPRGKAAADRCARALRTGHAAQRLAALTVLTSECGGLLGREASEVAVGGCELREERGVGLELAFLHALKRGAELGGETFQLLGVGRGAWIGDRTERANGGVSSLANCFS